MLYFALPGPLMGCADGYRLQVTFTASVVPAVDSVLLGPSDGVVLFSVSGSSALSYVHKTILGSAVVARSNTAAGTARLTVHRKSKGVTLLPGARELYCQCCPIMKLPCLACLSVALSGVRPRPYWGQLWSLDTPCGRENVAIVQKDPGRLTLLPGAYASHTHVSDVRGGSSHREGREAAAGGL